MIKNFTLFLCLLIEFCSFSFTQRLVLLWIFLSYFVAFFRGGAHRVGGEVQVSGTEGGAAWPDSPGQWTGGTQVLSVWLDALSDLDPLLLSVSDLGLRSRELNWCFRKCKTGIRKGLTFGLYLYMFYVCKMCMFCIVFNLIWLSEKPWGDPVRLAGLYTFNK